MLASFKKPMAVLALLICALVGSVAFAQQTEIDPASRQVNGNLRVKGTTNLAVLDAGSVLVRGDLQVQGSITGNASHTGTNNFAVIDAGTELVRGDLQVLGKIPVATIDLLDAGSGQVNGLLNVNGPLMRAGVRVPNAAPHDGGSPLTGIEWGYVTLSSNAANITFKTAFTVTPVCGCNSTNATAAACDVSVPTTTGATLKGANASDSVSWMCIGDR